MILYFLRHGEAGTNFSSDAERELTDRGIASVRSVGKFLSARNILITRLLCSPLLRARQTAETLVQEIPPIDLEVTEHLTPESDPKHLLMLLRNFLPESAILCVTHEPFASTCLSTLISGNESANIAMKTAAIACVETNGFPSRGNGRLLWLIPPDVSSALFPVNS